MKQNNLDSISSANYEGFSLVSGGLIYSLTSVFRRKGEQNRDRLITAIALALITWLPLCLLALYYGTLNDNDTTISFFEDFLVHVRFLIIIPFLILIEGIVDKTFVEYIKNTDNIIPNEEQKRYNQLVKRLGKLGSSFIPEIIILAVYYISIIINPQLLSYEDSARNYLINGSSNTLNIAGWYNFAICVPIFLLLNFRWAWRWIIWVYSIIKISHFKLFADPLHADKVAGLGYLNLVPLTFSFIIMAPAAMMSALIGSEIIYNNASFMSYTHLILFYIFFMPIILYSPLFLFIPKLINAKREGMLKFGGLVREHNYNYVKKWIDGKPVKDQSILGTLDNSSLADINGSYAPVEEMQLSPIDLRLIAVSIIMFAVPFIPLIFTYYSFAELFDLLMKSFGGG